MTPAIDAARRLNLRHRVIELERGPARHGANRLARGYGLEAAAALGVPAGHVFKTLIAKFDGRALVAALVPVSTGLDLRGLARLAGRRRAELATAVEAERATGYVVGGISPLGQRRVLATYADESALDLELVYVSAGRRGLEIALDPRELIAACAARVGPIAR